MQIGTLLSSGLQGKKNSLYFKTIQFLCQFIKYDIISCLFSIFVIFNKLNIKYHVGQQYNKKWNKAKMRMSLKHVGLFENILDLYLYTNKITDYGFQEI